jgi:microcystin degradation protein MlrC
MIKLPLLLPGEFAVTDIEPARSLYGLLAEVARVPGILDCSLVIGCAWTDSPYTAVSVIVVAEHDHTLAYEHAARLATAVWEQRASFGPETPTMAIDDAIATALSRPERPVFLSDAGDNVTAGAAGDIPLAAERLIAAGAVDAVVMGLADAQAVADCARAGVGGQLITQLGGKLDTRHGSPLSVTGVVAHLDPPEQPTLAVLRVEGVAIVVTADRRGFTTRASFEQANIDPGIHKIVVVKQGYLFPELREQAALAFMTLSPGCTDLRLDALPFQRLQRPIFPLDPMTEWRPENG